MTLGHWTFNNEHFYFKPPCLENDNHVLQTPKSKVLTQSLKKMNTYFKSRKPWPHHQGYFLKTFKSPSRAIYIKTFCRLWSLSSTREWTGLHLESQWNQKNDGIINFKLHNKVNFLPLAIKTKGKHGIEPASWLAGDRLCLTEPD